MQPADGFLYNDFGTWIRRRFPFRVQKISVNAGLTCPNRDGRISTGGCSFCNNEAFSPAYCRGGQTVAQQLAAGKAFFARKYSGMKFLAYFQAYTNTYGAPDALLRLYEEALAVDGVVGLVVGTRPDCVDDGLLDRLAQLARQTFVMVEFGVESANDATLRRVNRGHDFACSQRALAATRDRGLLTGAHVILGLPGEDAAESLRQAPLVGALPADVLKIHQLQVVSGTPLASQFRREPFHVCTVEGYIALVASYIERLPRRMVLERFVSQSPPRLVVAPRWGLKNQEFARRLHDYMRSRGMYQGRLSEAPHLS